MCSRECSWRAPCCRLAMGWPQLGGRADRPAGHGTVDRRVDLLRRAARVVQARDTALVLGDSAINVVRRGSDGAWRYTIALLYLEPTPTKEET